MSKTNSIRAGKAFVEVFTDNSKLVSGLRAAESKVKAFGGKIRNIGAALTGLSAAILTPLAGAMKVFSSYGDEVAKMSKRTGVSVETLSELSFVASQSGTEFATLENAFRKMQKSIYDAERGLSTAVDGLADLGLKFEDLKNLSPEQQFKLMADRMSQIKDPTKAAGVAMAIFGRTGTNLLPMFQQGAKGIEELQQKARELGLTMSGEDAKAAEDFTDAMDSVWKQVKMVTFQVGAALGPTVTDLSGIFKRCLKTIIDWCKANKELIKTVAKVALIVGGVGIAIMTLGVSIQGLGFAIGGLATVAKIVITSMAMVKVAIAALLTPIGLTLTAITGLTIGVLIFTGQGAAALKFLSNAFMTLKDEAVKTFGAIGKAVAAGDLGLAAEVLWLSIKLQFQKGKTEIAKIWSDFTFGLSAAFTQVKFDVCKIWAGLTAELKKLWADFTFGCQALFYGLKYEISNIWLGLVNVLKNAWDGFMKWHATTVNTLSNKLAKAMLHIQGLFDKDFDVEFAVKQVDSMTSDRQKEIDDEFSKKKKANDKEYADSVAENKTARDKKFTELATDNQDKLQKATDEYNKALADLKKARDERFVDLTTKNQTEISEAEQALEKARSAWQSAVDRSNELSKSGEGSKLSEFDPGEIADSISKATASVRGSFQHVRGFGGGSSAADRTAVATEQTAKNTSKILKEQKKSDLKFT
ncbi:MAG TPA: hypothetical protein PLK08_07610, partial [Phycisphaerae bacterium]|nr:hypothetical protein [Phycisphaerae bacterium]